MFNKLKQFNDLRKKANSLKNTLAQETVSIENKGVKITMDGNQEIKELEINKDLLAPDKKNELEKYIKEGFADSIKKVQRKMAEKMRQSGDFDFPGLS